MKKRSFLLALPILALASSLSPGLRADSGQLKIIKFEAVWCGACKEMKPIFASVAKSTPGVVFENVDIDQQGSLADRYKVELLPTLVAVKNGKVVGRVTGYQNETKLKRFVKRHR